MTFRVDVDEVWHTRRAEVSVVADDGRRRTVLESDAAGSWRQDGRSVPELDGCLDIDIAATPFTNTLPMRRLKLDVGEEAAIDAAWLGIPDLELERADQIYQRLGRNAEGLEVWRYALPGGQAYALIVDDEAIVIDYESFATKIDG